jgi:predicted amidohydrolase YtcJ
MKTKLKIALTLIAILVAAGWGATTWLLAGGLRPAPVPARALVGATILTLDREGTVAEALLLEGDRIAAVGSREAILAAAPEGTIVNDLGGRTVLPGIIEAHGHFPGIGLAAVAVDLNAPPIGDVADLATLLARLEEGMETYPGDDLLVGYGYDDTAMREGRHPQRSDLDTVSAERPIFLIHVSGHLGVANSAALELVGIDESSEDPAGGRIEREPGSRRPNGVLYETASLDLRKLATEPGWRDRKAMVDHAIDVYLRAGVTTVQNGLATPMIADALSLASRIGVVPQRVVLWPDWETSGLLADDRMAVEENAHLRLGATKLVADGSIQGYTAYLREPYFRAATEGAYADEKWRGEPTLDAATLTERMTTLFGQGRQVAIHGNGDAAIDMILDAVEAAGRVHPREDRRTVLIHAQTLAADQIARCLELDVTPSFFVAHTWFWGDRHYDMFLGPERAARISPLASSKRAGLRFTTHLDTPIVPIDPWRSAAAAVERRTPGGRVLGENERVDVETALRSMTIDAAWQVFAEDRIGSLEVGKFGDFIVVDRNPFEAGEDLAATRVLATVVGGVVAWQEAGMGLDPEP